MTESVSHVMDCPYCWGGGCSECDESGSKVVTIIEDGDVSLRVAGSAMPSAETIEALNELSKAAFARMDQSKTSTLERQTDAPAEREA